MAKDKDEVPDFSDEEWAEFERRFTAESAKSASYKEPSARQRELTAKWKKEPPKDTGWRTDGPGPDPRPRELYPPAASAGPRPKPVWKRNLAWVLVAILVTGAAVGLPSLFSGSPKKAKDDGGSQTNGQSAYVAPLPSQSADAQAADDPFAGSDAEHYATGENGIVLPTAVALRGYSIGDVAKLESQAKQFLIAANLDPAVLAGGTPETALAMLDPKSLSGRPGAGEQSLADALRGDLAHPTAQNDPTSLFTRFRSAETVLASSAAIRVHGGMTASLDDEGQLQVKADYLFVYAVRPAGHADVPATRVIIRRELTLTSLNPKKYQVTAGKIVLSEWQDYHVGMPCGPDDGFFHPVFDVQTDATASQASPEPVVGTVDPYDLTKPPPGGCDTATRT
jgi:hypothetical protein